MNGAVLLIIASLCFLLGYFLYGKLIERKLGIDPARPTPADERADGQDYVPTNRFVLYGSHFAAIAGAGPVIGPVLAAEFGWAAVALWVILGCVFIGAMHDMATLYLSVRHDGKSIGSIIEGVLGPLGKRLFLIFCFVTLIFVMAEFTRQVALSFVKHPEVASASMLSIPQAGIFGYLVYRRKWSVLTASVIFVPMLFGLLWLGIAYPCDLVALTGVSAATAQMIWTGVLLGYCFIASAFPVWLMLQPRGYLNAYLLYVMLALGVLGIVLFHPTLQANAFSGMSVEHPLKGAQSLFPLLFVTVACGACSGFHSLVASGTSSKQVANERDIRFVGYGAMLLEGVVAIMALISVAYLPQTELMARFADAKVGPVELFAGGIARFATSFGLPEGLGESFVMLAVAAFLMTTVDACTRLARFTWQEMIAGSGDRAAQPSAVARVAGNSYVATGIVVALCLFLLVGCPSITGNLWTIFASGNQILASLTLLTATLWLRQNGRRCWFTFMPLLFMIATSMTAVSQLCLGSTRKWMHDGFSAGGVTAIGSFCMLALAVVIFMLGIKAAMRNRRVD